MKPPIYCETSNKTSYKNLFNIFCHNFSSLWNFFLSLHFTTKRPKSVYTRIVLLYKFPTGWYSQTEISNSFRIGQKFRGKVFFRPDMSDIYVWVAQVIIHVFSFSILSAKLTKINPLAVIMTERYYSSLISVRKTEAYYLTSSLLFGCF